MHQFIFCDPAVDYKLWSLFLLKPQELLLVFQEVEEMFSLQIQWGRLLIPWCIQVSTTYKKKKKEFWTLNPASGKLLSQLRNVHIMQKPWCLSKSLRIFSQIISENLSAPFLVSFLFLLNGLLLWALTWPAFWPVYFPYQECELQHTQNIS